MGLGGRVINVFVTYLLGGGGAGVEKYLVRLGGGGGGVADVNIWVTQNENVPNTPPPPQHTHTPRHPTPLIMNRPLHRIYIKSQHIKSFPDEQESLALWIGCSPCTQEVEGSTPTGGICSNDFSDPIDQEIRTQ